MATTLPALFGGIPVSAAVVNCHADSQGLAPPAFQALTLAKVVLKPSEDREYDVPAMPLWSMTFARNDDEVETCTWFDVAVGEAAHCICVVTATPVALSCRAQQRRCCGGLDPGAVTVVNCRTDDQGPAPPVFQARTLPEVRGAEAERGQRRRCSGDAALVDDRCEK